MTESEKRKEQVAELLANAKPPETVLEIAREYSKSRTVPVSKLTAILGDQTTSVTMPSTEQTVTQLFCIGD